MEMKEVLAAALLLLCCKASAALEWKFKNVKIKEAAVYREVTSSGSSFFTLEITIEGHQQTGCGPTDTHGVITKTTQNAFSSNWQMRYSTILSAQAQGLPVDILVNNSSCHTGSSWAAKGDPTGRGWELEGIRVRHD